jgi:hypothetical protein
MLVSPQLSLILRIAMMFSEKLRLGCGMSSTRLGGTALDPSLWKPRSADPRFLTGGGLTFGCGCGEWKLCYEKAPRLKTVELGH